MTAAVAAAVAAVQPAEVDVQEPFQPGSTPAHLSSRFMVWNSVGMVRGYSGEDDNSVEVNFRFNGFISQLLSIIDLVDYSTLISWLSSKFWSINF